MLRVIVSLLCAGFLGCGGGPSGEDGGSSDATAPGMDGGKDASLDASSDATRDSSIDSPVDAQDDAPVDAPYDGPIGSLTGSISNQGLTVYQNCMPIVSQDPVHVSLSYTVTNNGNVTVGPITPTNGRLLDANNTEIIKFTFNAKQLGPINVNMMASDTATKKLPSAMPANYCSTLSCNGQQVKVEMELAGNALPQGFKLTSGLTNVMCVY